LKSGNESSVETNGYITNLHILNSKNIPANMLGSIIPIDLNEGAGGKYIYLYYEKNNYVSHINFVGVVKSKNKFDVKSWLSLRNLIGVYGDNGIYDLNAGAGGDYVHAYYSTTPNLSDPAVQDIAIVSGNSSNTAYPNNAGGNWTKINVDLNAGAGGKYIYMFYKMH
jgi:hypothetical protein